MIEYFVVLWYGSRWNKSSPSKQCKPRKTGKIFVNPNSPEMGASAEISEAPHPKMKTLPMQMITKTHQML